MNDAVQYEFAEVLQAGEDFKISLFFDPYGNQVASKALIDSSDESALSRLNAQAEFLKNSQHPSIANFRDKADNELFMEAMAGDVQTLAANLRKQFSAGETVSFMRQMLTLLSHLDSRGLTAGQFSPRTILGNEDLTIFKIPIAYMKDSPIPADPAEKIFPPEINFADDYDVHASDIYCLGMTCVELALGRVGFESLFKGMYDNSSDLWIRWHENQHETLPELAEILEGFPKGLTGILQKMIEKPLHLRFASADEVLSELNKIGIVDDKATVKKTVVWSPIAKKIGVVVAALIATAIWIGPVSEPDGTIPPVSYAVSVDSNKPIELKVVAKNGDDLSHSIVRSKSISLQEEDQLLIRKPDWFQKGWHLSVNGDPCTFDDENEIRLANFEESSFKLRFSRSLVFKSNYNDFDFKLEQSSLEAFSFIDTPQFQITDPDRQKYVWVKPNDPNLKFSQLVPDANGWFMKPIPQDKSTIELKFMVPIEVGLVVHGSISDYLSKLTVRVDGKELKPNGDVYVREFPYFQQAAPNWEVTVAYNPTGENLFQKRWDQIPSASKLSRKLELNGNVRFNLPAGYVLREANGKTNIKAREGEFEVNVPFGKNLEFVITDDKGVIQFREKIAWTTHPTFALEDHLQEKRLRNQGNRAEYYLVRNEDPSVRKWIGRTRAKVKLPSLKKSDYSVVVEWSPNYQLTIPLEEFLASRISVEFLPAATALKAPAISAQQGSFAIK